MTNDPASLPVPPDSPPPSPPPSPRGSDNDASGEEGEREAVAGGGGPAPKKPSHTMLLLRYKRRMTGQWYAGYPHDATPWLDACVKGDPAHPPVLNVGLACLRLSDPFCGKVWQGLAFTMMCVAATGQDNLQDAGGTIEPIRFPTPYATGFETVFGNGAAREPDEWYLENDCHADFCEETGAWSDDPRGRCQRALYTRNRDNAAVAFYSFPSGTSCVVGRIRRQWDQALYCRSIEPLTVVRQCAGPGGVLVMEATPFEDNGITSVHVKPGAWMLTVESDRGVVSFDDATFVQLQTRSVEGDVETLRLQTPADDEGQFPEGLEWHATDDPDHNAITSLGSLQSALYVPSDREWYAERTVKVLEQFADLATGTLREPPEPLRPLATLWRLPHTNALRRKRRDERVNKFFYTLLTRVECKRATVPVKKLVSAAIGAVTTALACGVELEPPAKPPRVA